MGVTVTPSFAQLRNKPTTVAGFGITDMNTQTVANATNATAVPFTGVTGKPTTLTGYGITDEKCKAWVNFNGTGVVAIRAGFNVSSITDNGVGDYTVNFTTAMPDANYAPIGSSIGVNASGGGAFVNGHISGAGLTTNSCRFAVRASTNVILTDYENVQLAIFR